MWIDHKDVIAKCSQVVLPDLSVNGRINWDWIAIAGVNMIEIVSRQNRRSVFYSTSPDI